MTPSTKTHTSPKSGIPHARLPWYRGLWWTIWLTIFATIITYGAGTIMYFRFVIAPQLAQERQALQEEKEAYIIDFRQYLQTQTAQYHADLETWRMDTPPGTPPPEFDYRNRTRQFRENRDQKERHGDEDKSRDENPINTWLWLSSMVFLMGLATYPVAKRLTRRLEKLQQGVENFGAGSLNTRVEVSGHDEVALLAKSFNASAQEIERLLQQHKQLLAHVSHELRTPLARLRMSAELAASQVPKVATDLRTDIKELDNLVGEILLASRLDATPDLLQISSFDALALAAEESARTCAQLEGYSVEIQADETLIRRAIRNLLTNAERYAPNTPVKINVSLEKATPQQVEQVCFTVSDHGIGLKNEEERVKIFEPFFRAQGGASVSGGTGLGLSLVQQIAVRHEGSVVCLAQPEGTGCIFELRIPTQVPPPNSKPPLKCAQIA